jgi:restriction endonuclease Mrr
MSGDRKSTSSGEQFKTSTSRASSFTTSGIATGAKKVSIKPGAVPVILVDGPSIADLMIDKGFGVQSDILPIYTSALDGVFSDDEDQKA